MPATSAAQCDGSVLPNSSFRNATGYGHNSGTANTNGLTTADMMTASEFVWTDFGTTPGGASGQVWVIADSDGSLNNAGSATGGTFPMLLSEYSTNIVNAHQLQLMELVLSANYTLANSINASATNGADVWGTAGFVPLGGNNAGADFTGAFDGGGHTIRGLTIDNTTDSQAGLFGDIGSGGTVENLKFTNAAISSNVSASDIGILVGESQGSVTDVTASGAVALDATTGYAGGLAGENTGGSVGASSSSATVSDTIERRHFGRLGGLQRRHNRKLVCQRQSNEATTLPMQAAWSAKAITARSPIPMLRAKSRYKMDRATMSVASSAMTITPRSVISLTRRARSVTTPVNIGGLIGVRGLR